MRIEMNPLAATTAAPEIVSSRTAPSKKTTAYLILATPGTSSSSKTIGIGEGELGMTAGFLQSFGISGTGHASLLVLNPKGDETSKAIYLSFYPSGGGMRNSGAFVSLKRDGLYNLELKHSIYCVLIPRL